MPASVQTKTVTKIHVRGTLCHSRTKFTVPALSRSKAMRSHKTPFSIHVLVSQMWSLLLLRSHKIQDL